MRNFIKKWFMIFGLTVISTTAIPAIIHRHWDSIAVFIFQLLFVILIICLLQLLTEKITTHLLLKYLLDIAMSLAVVFLFGWFWNWYEPSYAWIMPAMVIPVFVIGYFFDIVKIKKDVDFINKQIELRQKKLEKKPEEEKNP